MLTLLNVFGNYFRLTDNIHDNNQRMCSHLCILFKTNRTWFAKTRDLCITLLKKKRKGRALHVGWTLIEDFVLLQMVEDKLAGGGEGEACGVRAPCAPGLDCHYAAALDTVGVCRGKLDNSIGGGWDHGPTLGALTQGEGPANIHHPR